MKLELPRIKSVSVAGPAKLKVAWRNAAKADTIDLTGWIATGGGVLSALFDPQTFRQASVTNYGAAIDWNDADLAIDAAHLKLIAEEQRPFSGSDAEKWQRRVEISNNEVADLLGISLSTWNDYKARKQALLPAAVAMICRAVLRDPLLMQAHFRPRFAGRPKKAASARKYTRKTVQAQKRAS